MAAGVLLLVVSALEAVCSAGVGTLGVRRDAGDASGPAVAATAENS